MDKQFTALRSSQTYHRIGVLVTSLRQHVLHVATDECLVVGQGVQYVRKVPFRLAGPLKMTMR